MVPDFDQLRSKNFDFLKLKYRVDTYSSAAGSDLLYGILQRANAGYSLIDSEQLLLRQHQLLRTLEIIRLEKGLRDHHAQAALDMQTELIQLQAQYQVETCDLPPTLLYPLLKKLDSEHSLNSVEMQVLADYQLFKLKALAEKIQDFAALKRKYQATAYPDFLPDSLLYQILQDWELQQSLSDSALKWLLDQNLLQTVAFYEQQEQDRRAELDLRRLKQKYQVSHFLDPSASKRLHRIMQRLEVEWPLTAAEVNWLSQKPALEPLRFVHLKQKYGVLRFTEQSSDCILIKILEAFENQDHLSQAQLDWIQAYAPELSERAAHNHFAQLCRKYRIIQPQFEPF